MPAKPNPVVFVHGYSDKGASWAAWRDILRRRLALDNTDMRTCTYVSLNNEVTIKDLAEAFDRALSTQGAWPPTSRLTRSCIRRACWSSAHGSLPIRCGPSG